MFVFYLTTLWTVGAGKKKKNGSRTGCSALTPGAITLFVILASF